MAKTNIMIVVIAGVRNGEYHFLTAGKTAHGRIYFYYYHYYFVVLIDILYSVMYLLCDDNFAHLLRVKERLGVVVTEEPPSHGVSF